MNNMDQDPDEIENDNLEQETEVEEPSESADEALDPLAEAQKKIDALKEQSLRAMAEVENTRRRMKKELVDAQKYAVSSFAKEILTVSDNFTRALEAVPEDVSGDETLKNLVTGVEAIERHLVATFEKFEIKKIDPLGLPFDPHFHRVMMEQEDLTQPVGTVLQVFQPGYMIHDRLLREAMVVVSKGGPVSHKIDQEA